MTSRPNFPLYAVHKDLDLTQAPIQKSIEIISHNENYYVDINFLFGLLSTEQGLVLEKDGIKKDLVETLDSGCGKVVFARLNKIITMYVGLAPIDI